MKRIIFLFGCGLLFWSGCNKQKLFDGPDQFSEGFESTYTFEQLFEEEGGEWSFFQKTVPENIIIVDSSIVHSGNHSLRFEGVSAAEGVKKCSIAKQNMAFWESETVHLEAWYYLVGNDPKDYLFLMDIEEQTAIGAGPGIRLAIGPDDRILVNFKYNQPTINQESSLAFLKFPRDQWVKLEMEILLAQNKKGSIQVWQDNQLIIEAKNIKTLPTDFLYGLQGTKGQYTSLEFGITANSDQSATTLYLDDVVATLK